MATGDGIYNVLNENPDDFSTVRPGEVCSIETAKELGVFHSTNYYTQALADTRTYGDAVANDASRKHLLCTESVESNSAQPLCPLVAPGLQAHTVDGETRCKYPSCPPGFTKKTNGDCSKPKVRNIVNRSSKCQEQWHDWFTVPNYHMGNGYATEATKCYAPCPSFHVPLNGTDPDTGKNRGTTKLDVCVDKIEYLGGKFADESDFCTISWVKRLSSDAESIMAEAEGRYPQYLYDGVPKVRQDAQVNVANAVVASHARLENLQNDSVRQVIMCKNTVETEERLKAAYETCKEVLTDRGQANSPAYRTYADRMRRSFPSITDKEVKDKWRILNQACHYSFCDEVSDRAGRIHQPPLVFPAEAIARIDLDGKQYTTPEFEAASTAEPYPKLDDVSVDLMQWYKYALNAFVKIGELTILIIFVYYVYIYFARAFAWSYRDQNAENKADFMATKPDQGASLASQQDAANMAAHLETPAQYHGQKLDKSAMSWDKLKTVLNNAVMIIVMKYVVFVIALIVIFLLIMGALSTGRRSAAKPRVKRDKCLTSARGCGSAFGFGSSRPGQGGIADRLTRNDFKEYNIENYTTIIERDKHKAGRCDNTAFVEIGNKCAIAALPTNIKWRFADMSSDDFNLLPTNLQQVIKRFNVIEIPWTMNEEYLMPDCSKAFYKDDPQKLAVAGLEDGGDVCKLVAVEPTYHGNRVRYKGAALDDFSEVEITTCNNGACET